MSSFLKIEEIFQISTGLPEYIVAAIIFTIVSLASGVSPVKSMSSSRAADMNEGVAVPSCCKQKFLRRCYCAEIRTHHSTFTSSIRNLKHIVRKSSPFSGLTLKSNTWFKEILLMRARCILKHRLPGIHPGIYFKEGMMSMRVLMGNIAPELMEMLEASDSAMSGSFEGLILIP